MLADDPLRARKGQLPVNLRERVGTDQRIAVLDLLSKALAEGYLDLTEYDRRAVATHSAVTVGHLVAQLADLPRQFHWYPFAPAVAHPPRAANGPMAGIAVSLGAASVPMALCVGLGGLLGVAAVVLGGIAARDRANHALGVSSVVLGALGVVLSLGVLAIVILA